MLQACVVPVSAADALAWAGGQLQDADLLLRAPLVPEGIFLVSLPGRAAYRDCLKQILYWRRRGAVFLVTRTGNRIVDDHIVLKNRGRETYREAWQGANTQYRFVVLPEALDAWLCKFSRPSSSDPALAAGAARQPQRGAIPIPPMSA